MTVSIIEIGAGSSGDSTRPSLADDLPDFGNGGDGGVGLAQVIIASSMEACGLTVGM